MRIFAVALLMVSASYEEEAAKLEEKGKSASTPVEKMEIGDGYVKLLGRYPRKRLEIIDGASSWYAKAWKDLDLVSKEKLRARLKLLYSGSQVPKKFPLPKGMEGPVDPLAKAEVSSERSRSGLFSVRLAPPRNGKLTHMMSTYAVPASGKRLESSVWMLSDGTDGLEDKLLLILEDENGQLVSQHFSLIRNDFPIWNEWKLAIEIPEKVARAKFWFLLNSVKGIVFIDDVSLKVDGKELIPFGNFETR